MEDRTPTGPETTWGAIRALIQAGTGVAFALEGEQTIAGFLFVVAAATVVYEGVAWWRSRESRTAPRPRPRRPRHGARPRHDARPRHGARAGHDAGAGRGARLSRTP